MGETAQRMAGPISRNVRHHSPSGAREEAGKALALGHQDTAKALQASAAAYEQADDHAGAQIGRAGDTFGQPGGGPTGPTGPTGPAAPTVPGSPGHSVNPAAPLTGMPTSGRFEGSPTGHPIEAGRR